MFFRLLLLLGVAVGAFILALRVPGLDVRLFGDDAKGLFLLHSAALPVLLLLVNSWVENAWTVIRLAAVGVGIGASAGTAIKLAQELFGADPRIWFPLLPPFLPDSFTDERIWLTLNAAVALIITITLFASAGDSDSDSDEDEPDDLPGPTGNGQRP
jgi:hypothetical protein